MTATVRLATHDDVPAIIGVGHRSWRETCVPNLSQDYIDASLARWWTRDAIGWEVGGGRMLVAVQDDVVVGVASAGHLNGDLVLFKLYVLPEHQRSGAGRVLLERVLADARDGGHQIVRASYFDGVEHAEAFYLACGFRETHRDKAGDGVPESVWLVRDVWQECP